jgi:glycerol-3-phosphate acyltransferase PlsY
MMSPVLFVIMVSASYISGSVPYAVLFGWVSRKGDPRSVGDGNPGTINAFRLGGKKLGLTVLACDFLKALIPVAIAKWAFGFEEWQLFLIALMPTLGHAYSVFLGGEGGKAIVTLFGVWTALTLYLIPSVMGGMAILSLYLLKDDNLRTLLLPFSALICLLLMSAPIWMCFLAGGQFIIVLSKMIAKSG